MTLGNGVLSIFAATVFYLVGTSLYVFYTQNPDLLMTTRQDLVFATYITYELPEVLLVSYLQQFSQQLSPLYLQVLTP